MRCHSLAAAQFERRTKIRGGQAAGSCAPRTPASWGLSPVQLSSGLAIVGGYLRSIAWGEWGSSRPSRVNASRFSYERIALGHCVGVCGRAGRGRAVGGCSTQLYAEHLPQLRRLYPRPRCHFDDQCRRQRRYGTTLRLRYGIGGLPDPKRCVQHSEPCGVSRRHRYLREHTHILAAICIRYRLRRCNSMPRRERRLVGFC